MCQKNVQWLRHNLFEEGRSLASQTQAQTTSFQPLRLIDVNPEGSHDCRLVLTGDKLVSPHSPYLALSYRWGNPEDAQTQFKTKSKTIDDRMRGFLLESTSQCIRDAIEVARALGIQYLWVDALCILQDDESDWELQSAQMARIYRNATAVICAAASSSCHQGFLERNKTSASIKFQSHIDPAVSGYFNVTFCSKSQWPHCGNFSTANMETSGCDWSTRGWTYQELYLARRAIIFGRNKIHYRSSDIVWSENEKSTMDGTIISLHKSSMQETDDEFISGWINAISLFSDRHFSNILDRLPAISGLAETVSGGCPDQYLAGIRKSHLHHDLVWALDSWSGILSTANGRAWAISSLQSPNPYIAPSWSWASRKTGICGSMALKSFMLGRSEVQDFDKEYSKVETHVSVIGKNPYGHVSHGSLTFSAIVVPLWARLEMDNPFWTQFLGESFPVPRRNLRYHSGDDFSARVLLDWVASKKHEPIDDLSFFLLGSCHQRGKYRYRKPRDWSSSSESEDELSDAEMSGTKGSNDDSDNDWSTVSDEDVSIKQATPPAVDDVDYNNRLSGPGCSEIKNEMKAMPARREDHQDEASYETQSEPEQKASTSNLSTAPPSSHESEEGANEFDDLFERESEPDTECSRNDSFEGRIAYGLIIHPTGKPGQFFRVGVWASHDIEFFRGRQESTFELI